MDMILEKTVELVLQIYRYYKIFPPKVNNVVIGLGYTGVELIAMAYDPFLGLAYTLPSIIRYESCTKNKFAGKLTDKPFYELISWSFEPPSLKKIIGIATLNAASQHILEIKNPYTNINVDLVEYLRIDENSRILFIGNIVPMIRQVSNLTENITMVDDNPYLDELNTNIKTKRSLDELDPEESNVDVLFCTGTTVINESLESILKFFRKKAKSIVLLGPTASFIPDILFDYGVKVVGGMRIIDPKSTLRILQEGGGTKLFNQYGEKYNLTN